MAKSSHSLDEQLKRLAALKSVPSSPEAQAEVQKGLASKNNFVVAKAADIAREKRMRELMTDLVAAFARHMIEPVKTDKGCEAKAAIVRALHELDYDQTDVFEQGSQHVQMEPAWGGSVDTAIGLRRDCATALSGNPHNRRALKLLLPLLVDPARQVRSSAARAIAHLGRAEGELLLRLKALSGDLEADVTGDCLAAVLDLGGEDSLEFVVKFLDADSEATREAAALAIGASRVRGAFEVLEGAWKANASPSFASVILLAMATQRDERAETFLLSIIQKGSFKSASETIRAIKAVRNDERTREAMAKVIHDREDDALLKVLNENT